MAPARFSGQGAQLRYTDIMDIEGMQNTNGFTDETFAAQRDQRLGAAFDNAPIGVFDSGYGGLTVAREIMKALPHESILYVGDTARCPYGPRSLDEVDGFVQQIGRWLVGRQVKLIVIACNTATAAGLKHAQQVFDVPVIGVVESGARAAAHATKNGRVGVIGTRATVESDIYTNAIRNINAGITVFSTATPRFVEIAEQGIRMAEGPIESYTSLASKVYIRPAFQEIAQDYLEPLRRCEVDTLVLGCTHFPLLKSLIGGVIGREVLLISSDKEVVKDVHEILSRQGKCAQRNRRSSYEFYTTGADVAEFENFGSRVLRLPLASVSHLDLP
ncbi:MAG: glutamate racemase [Raoultibacter sp.]